MYLAQHLNWHLPFFRPAAEWMGSQWQHGVYADTQHGLQWTDWHCPRLEGCRRVRDRYWSSTAPICIHALDRYVDVCIAAGVLAGSLCGRLLRLLAIA